MDPVCPSLDSSGITTQYSIYFIYCIIRMAKRKKDPSRWNCLPTSSTNWLASNPLTFAGIHHFALEDRNKRALLQRTTLVASRTPQGDWGSIHPVRIASQAIFESSHCDLPHQPGGKFMLAFAAGIYGISRALLTAVGAVGLHSHLMVPSRLTTRTAIRHGGPNGFVHLTSAHNRYQDYQGYREKQGRKDRSTSSASYL